MFMVIKKKEEGGVLFSFRRLIHRRRLALQFKVLMLTGSSAALPVVPSREILSSDGVIQMFPQPLSSAAVPVLSEKKPGLIKRHLTNRANPWANPLIVLSAHNPKSARRYVCHRPCWRTYFEALMHMSVYLQSRNTSTPAKRSRRMRQTRAAVVPLSPVSHGAAVQE